MSNLNLIPYSLKEKKIAEEKKKYYSYILIFVVIFIFVGITAPQLILNDLMNRELYLKTKLDNSSYIIETNKSNTETVNEYRNHIKKVEELTSNRIMLSNKIVEFEKHIPVQIVLRNINCDRSSMVLQGGSSSYEAISEFVANIEISKAYKMVRIDNIASESSNNSYNFTVTIEL